MTDDLSTKRNLEGYITMQKEKIKCKNGAPSIGRLHSNAEGKNEVKKIELLQV